MMGADNIIFLGAMYSDNQKEPFLSKSKRGYQFAAQNLQESYVDGLEKNGVNLKVLSFPPLSTYPAGSRIIKVEREPFILNGRTLGYNLGYINIPFINHPSRKEAVSIIEKWIHEFTEPSYIVVYSLNRFLMSVASEVKKHHSNLGLCIIIPDLLEYMGCNKYYKMLGLQERDKKEIYQMIPCFDKYILLTEAMASRLGIAKSNYSIIEGIYKGENSPMFEKEKEKVILYTGGLSVRYGIPDLVEAFSRIKDDNYRLWLCGYGDAVSFINNFAEKDNRIKNWGQIPKEKVLELQKKATLLVNPRHSDEEFTKFSFPSKTIEYMASGTPLLMNHLKCIPKEYEDFIFFAKDESVEGWRNEIERICEQGENVLQSVGDGASIFIKEKKNSKYQVKKMLKLLLDQTN